MLSPVYQKRAKTNVWLFPIILEGHVVVYPLVPYYNYWSNSHATEDNLWTWVSPRRLVVSEPVWNWAGTRHVLLNEPEIDENPNLCWDMVQADDGHKEEEKEEVRGPCYSRPLTTSYLGNAFQRQGEEKGHVQMRRMNRQQRRPRRINHW